jgi:hypothetical protein
MIVYAGVGGKAEASDLGHWFELVLTLLFSDGCKAPGLFNACVWFNGAFT